MNETLQFIVVGTGGALVHTLIKLAKLRKLAAKANMALTVQEFWANDWPYVSLSFMAPLLWLFLFREAMAKYPSLEGWVSFSFFFVGLGGSYILQSLDDTTKRKVTEVIDQKTDKADGVAPKQ